MVYRLRRSLVLLLVLLPGLALPAAAEAPCGGTDLIAALPAPEQARLRAAVAEVPFASGNFWLARRGDAVLTLVGTLHLDDPRFDAVAASLRSRIAASGRVLVEAGPDQEALMKAAIFKDTALVLNAAGASLKDRLAPAEWQALAKALADRGLPAVMGQRMRPWILMAMLAIPPCEARAMLAAGREAPNGLDQRIMTEAKALAVPIESLEPWDAALKSLTGLPPEKELQLLTSALALDPTTADVTHTLREAYFAGQSRLFWEFYRSYAVSALAAVDPALAEATARDTEAALALLEGPLIRDRNKSWIAVIDAAAATSSKPVLVAFGALHLPGEDGVLNLLAKDGWTVEPLSLTGP